MRLEPLNEESWECVEKALNTGHYTAILQTSEELHYFAAPYNWDAMRLEPLRWVLSHPPCDKGTAVMLYWMCQPKSLYAKYANREQVDKYDLEAYDLIKEIEEKILAGYYIRQNLGYPTTASRKRDWWIRYSQEYQQQEIPEKMLDFSSAEAGYEVSK